MVGKPGIRIKRRGHTRLLAGLSAVAAGLLLFYFARESSAGGRRLPQPPQQPLLPLQDGLRGAAVNPVTSELTGTADPATFASTSGEGERRVVAGGDVVLPVAVLAEAQAATGSAGVLMNTDDPLPRASSAGTETSIGTAAADAGRAAADSAAQAGGGTHKFLDGVMKEGGQAADAATASGVARTSSSSSSSAKAAGTTAAAALVDRAEAVAGSAAPEAKPLGLYFKGDVKEEAKKRGSTVARRQAIARLRTAGAAGEGAANETKPLGFYFGLNANEKDQAGLTVGGKDDSQGVAAGIAQKAVAAQQLAEQGGDVRLFSLARRLLWRPFRRRS